MELELEIVSLDRNISSEIMNSRTVSTELVTTIGDGVSIRFDGEGFTKISGAPIDVSFIISIAPGLATGVAEGLISAWLYDKLRGKKVETVKIDHTEVNFNDQGEIERVIETKITRETR